MIMVNGVNQMDDLNNLYNVDALNLPLNSINRIEVVRGPMAVIYGSSAFLGVINIITNDFDATEKNEINMSGGSLSTLGGNGFYSKKDNDFKHKTSISYQQSEGLNLNYNDLISNPTLQLAYTGKENSTTYKQLAKENVYVGFNGEYKDFFIDFSQQRYSSGNFAFLPSVSAEGFKTTSDYTFFRTGIQPQLNKHTQLTLKYTTSIFHWRGENIQLLSSSNYSSYSTQSSNHDVDVTINYNKNKIDLVTGLSYRLVPSVQRFTDIPIFGMNRIYTNTNSPFATKSFFTQANYKIHPKLKITAGIRLEHTNDYKLKSTRTTTSSIGLDSTYSFLLDGQVNQGGLVLIPRIALVYSPNDKNFIKIMYGNSKRRASLGQSSSSSSSFVYNLGMASMNTLEVNFLSNILNNVNTNISVFYNQMSGLPVHLIDINGTDVTQNTTDEGKLSTIGSEVSIKYMISEKINVEASVSYQENINHTKGYDTISVAFTPNLLGYLKAFYRISNKISLGLKGRYVSSMFTEYDLINEKRYGDKTPDYFVIDLNIYAQNIYKGFGASIYTSNLLNTEIRYPTNNNASWLDKGMLGYGRRVNVSVFYKF